MRTDLRIIVSLSALLLLDAGTSLRAADWPKWRGPDGTGISTETGVAEKWPAEGPKQLWSHKVGIGYSSPVAIDGKIYFFSQEGGKDLLRAFDAEKGTVLWTESNTRGQDPPYPGTRATPTIENNRIYTLGSGGDLICRELANGKLVWQMNVLAETGAKPNQWGAASSPLIIDDNIYVQTGGGSDATVLAVNKVTGKITWKSETNAPAAYTTIVQADAGSQKLLVVLALDTVFGMDPKTGKTLWSEPCKADYDVNATTPVVRGNQVLISTGRKAGTMMLELKGTEKTRLWEQPAIQCKFQAGILDGDAFYANGLGTLKCINWADGKLLWECKDKNLNLNNGGSFVRAGDKLITMSERGKLSLVRGTPKEVEVISQVQLFDYTQVWSTPVIHRGKLYCKGKDELVCLEISGGGAH